MAVSERKTGGYEDNKLNLFNSEVDPDTKNGFLDEACELIELYTGVIVAIFLVFDELNIIKNSSVLINMRDAMFHYRQMYEKNNIIGLIEQQYAMKEHLNRGVKDGIIHLLNSLLERVEFYFSCNEQDKYFLLSKTDKKRYREILHKIKNYMLDIRIDSMNIERIFDQSKVKERISEAKLYISDLVKFLEDNDIDVYKKDIFRINTGS